MYLLDTNVVSELRKPKPHGAVVAWIQEIDDAELFLCAVTLGEIQAGIERTRMHDPVKAGELDRWADDLAGSYQMLALDAPIFRRWARYMHRRNETLYEDAMVAAVAAEHRLVVVTRNVRDFRIFAVPTFNPFNGKRTS